MPTQKRDRDKCDCKQECDGIAVLRDRKDLRIAEVGRFVLSGFSVDHLVPLDTPNDFFAEETFGANKQEQQCQHIREPAFNPATDKWTEIDLGQLL